MSYGFPQQKWKLSASSAPTVSDDRTTGYEPLSIWLKQSTGGIYICTSNAPGAATWQLVGSSSTTGTVTSVALTAPTEITVGGSPVTTTGTLALTWTSQTQNKVFASPNGSTGTPTFRALVAADIPNIAESQVTNLVTDLASANAAAGIALFDHFADANNGTTVETDLYSDTLTAGLLANNGEKVTAQYGGIFTGAALSTQQLRAYFGGTLIYDSGALTIGAVTDHWGLYVTVIRESATVVRCTVTASSDFTTVIPLANYTRVTGLTLSSTVVLKITGQAAGAGALSNQITATEGYGRWLKAA